MSSDRADSQNSFAARALFYTAVAAVIGPLIYIPVTLLHPSGVGNDHPAIFREYALSQGWIPIHLAQLTAQILAQIGIAGLAASMLRQQNGRLFALIAAVLAAASIPTTLVLQSVDGIALKRAVDVWVAEGATVGSPSFAAARALRWIEEGLNAVLDLTLGLTVITAGAAMIRAAVYRRWMGYIGVVIGIGLLISAIVFAETGFSPMAQTWVLARNPALWVWTAVAGAMMWRRNNWD